MKKSDTDIVNPFDWRRFAATDAGIAGTERPRTPAASRAKQLTVKERVDRIMAPRWGNPYSKPGPAY